ncbi:heterokaryon incompatibility protein-domain-containing protein [Dactylonectria estremocensis]|uniref:Heterokaryon incompatibility protein-domain-containing protein n=1 Tax=Dactylonectria estremocensis TaxID=1079267 RepID=A0A9P9J1S9_9HYPO|nr:heterokaryon incompatibility protein-domain-containing protein [Dactylonectria estremocensis]
MWPFKSTTPDLTSTVKGLDRQTVCKGCNRIEVLLDGCQQKKATIPGRLLFHKDYAELERCARNCHTCRVFRQALLLQCATIHDTEQLRPRTAGCGVYARVRYAESDGLNPISLKIELRSCPEPSAWIRCGVDMAQAQGLNLAEDPKGELIRRQVLKWLDGCNLEHNATCSGLRWSSENPSRLVRIVSESELQLCTLGDTPTKYVALSYSWGTKVLTEQEILQMEHGQTTHGNIKSRHGSFPLSDLPSTLRDAISFCRLVGLSYVWVDSICIIQDANDRSDFEREAPKMHQYYGNAYFTLAVCSNFKATDALLASRTAFSHPIRASSLGGLWVSTPDRSMAEMLSHSPLSKRAWTLQEESLSPRILYWTPQRMYWSCAQVQHIESTVQERPVSSFNLSSGPAFSPRPQAFLLACNRGTSEARHAEWLSLIESYTLRDMSNPTDRFPALASLASKYKDNANKEEEYIAGLWKTSFVQDLSWTVKVPVFTTPEFGANVPPSWTWASLPVCTGVHVPRQVNEGQHLTLLEIGLPAKAKKEINSADTVRSGALVTHVRVHARLRRFWQDSGVYRPWSEITSTLQQNNDMALPLTHGFTFANMPQQSVFSADVASGKVVSYEARKQEILGQLDYTVYATKIGDLSLDIFAMEIAESSMLLLEKLGEGRFQRVGIVTSYRPDFFEDASDVDLILQ